MTLKLRSQDLGMIESITGYIAATDALRSGKSRLSKSVKSGWFAYGTGGISLDHKVSKEWWEKL